MGKAAAPPGERQPRDDKIPAMRLTLLVPDLLPPPELLLPLRPAYRNVELLLGRGGCACGPGESFEPALFRIWDIAGLPVAPLTALADGLAQSAPGHVWLRADPVHLHIERDHIQMFDAHRFELAQHEADALAATLNGHFARDGLRIETPHPARWYVQVPAADAPASAPLWDVSGRSMFEHLPGVSGAADWKARGNEAQMMLYEHPVNAAREARGAVPVNGVWFWGAGTLPAVPSAHFTAVVTADALTLGLAIRAGIPAEAPRALRQLIERTREGTVLVAFGGLSDAIRAGDAARWSDAFTAADTDWFAPALQGLRDGTIGAVRVVAPSATRTLEATVRKSDLLKFWRRMRLSASDA